MDPPRRRGTFRVIWLLRLYTTVITCNGTSSAQRDPQRTPALQEVVQASGKHHFFFFASFGTFFLQKRQKREQCRKKREDRLIPHFLMAFCFLDDAWQHRFAQKVVVKSKLGKALVRAQKARKFALATFDWDDVAMYLFLIQEKFNEKSVWKAFLNILLLSLRDWF